MIPTYLCIVLALYLYSGFQSIYIIGLKKTVEGKKALTVGDKQVLAWLAVFIQLLTAFPLKMALKACFHSNTPSFRFNDILKHFYLKKST